MFRKKLKPELFRKMRENADLSRRELALLMDWSEGTIVNYETKECKMDLYEFEKFMMVTTTSKEDKEARQKLLKHVSDTISELVSLGEKTKANT